MSLTSETISLINTIIPLTDAASLTDILTFESRIRLESLIMTTLAKSISASSKGLAIIVPNKSLPLCVSYEQLALDVLQFQGKLAQLGIAAQSAVSIAIPNSYSFIVAFLAVVQQRAIAGPLNPNYKKDEFDFYIGDLQSGLILVPQGSYQQKGPVIQASKKHDIAIAECYWTGDEVALDIQEGGMLLGKGKQPLLEARPDDVALVLHTSGTTAKPKAVPLTHRNLTRTMSNITTTYALSKTDRTLLVMPLFHVHGLLAGCLSPLFAQGSVIVPPRFSATEFWDTFSVHRANWYTAVPTIHQILLQSPRPSPLPAIRFIRSCSSALSPKLFHDLEKSFNAPVLEAYAMTECAHQMTSNPLPPAKRIPGSVGTGQGVEIKILDNNGKSVPQGSEAEICVRGENVTKGYLNNHVANVSSFTRDGFFRTGDQGRCDKDGYVFLTGRIKELINKGGEKISPVELDNVVANNPAVKEAVTFAIMDEIYGQDIGLAVVLHDGQATTPDELSAWIGQRVAKFKIPKKVDLCFACIIQV